MQPLVSVIVPVYGVEKFIKEFAISVFNQTYDNIEILFVNDCTKDNSISILEETISQFPKIKDKVVIINHQTNTGSAGARLSGLLKAKGEYVIQFDSDDYVEYNIIEELVNRSLSESADIVICDYDLVGDTFSHIVSTNPPLKNIELIKKLYTGEVHSSLCNKLIKRKLYIDNGIKPTIGLNMCEDLSVMYKLVYYAKKISYIPCTLYHYRQNVANSYSAQKMPIKHQKNRIELLEQIDEFIINNTGNNSILRKYYKYLIISTKSEILLYGDLDMMSFFKKDIAKHSISNIFQHPNMHRNLKIISILDKLHLKPFVHLMRWLQRHKQYLVNPFTRG